MTDRRGRGRFEPGEVGPLEQREDVFGLDVDDLAQLVPGPAVGVQDQFHHVGRVVLDPLPPGEGAGPFGEARSTVGRDVGDHPAALEAEGRLGLGRSRRSAKTSASVAFGPGPDLDPEQAGVDRGPEPPGGVDPPERRPGHGEVVRPDRPEHGPGDGRLAEQGDRRPLRGELADQLEPDRLGDVEVRRAGHRVDPPEAPDVRPARPVRAPRGPDRGGRDPGEVADHQQPARPRTRGPAGEVDPEQVGRLDDQADARALRAPGRPRRGRAGSRSRGSREGGSGRPRTPAMKWPRPQVGSRTRSYRPPIGPSAPRTSATRPGASGSRRDPCVSGVGSGLRGRSCGPRSTGGGVGRRRGRLSASPSTERKNRLAGLAGCRRSGRDRDWSCWRDGSGPRRDLDGERDDRGDGVGGRAGLGRRSGGRSGSRWRSWRRPGCRSPGPSRWRWTSGCSSRTSASTWFPIHHTLFQTAGRLLGPVDGRRLSGAGPPGHAGERPGPGERLVVAPGAGPPGHGGGLDGRGGRGPGLLVARGDGGQLHDDPAGRLVPAGRGGPGLEVAEGVASVRLGGRPGGGHGIPRGPGDVLAPGPGRDPLAAPMAAGGRGPRAVHGPEPGLAPADAPRGRRAGGVSPTERRVRPRGRAIGIRSGTWGWSTRRSGIRSSWPWRWSGRSGRGSCSSRGACSGWGRRPGAGGWRRSWPCR